MNLDRLVKGFWVVWFLYVGIVIAFIIGAAFVVYKVLLHFGIL